jgi:hydroxymethylbilane synthase
VECCDTDPDLVSLLALVEDPAARAAVTAERAVLAELQAGCSAPVGAYAAATDIVRLTALVMGDDGSPPVRASAGGPPGEAARLGRDVARELLRRGAGRYVTAAAAHTSNGDDA